MFRSYGTVIHRFVRIWVLRGQILHYISDHLWALGKQDAEAVEKDPIRR
jgi:hypothetical protein